MRRITMITTAVAVAMTATVAFGQDKGWFTDSKHGEDLYDINFPGGTAAEYFNELGAELEGELNVIVKEGVDLVELPPINIKRVPGLDVIELPQRLDNALVIEATDNVSPSFGGPRDGVGVYTIVVRLGPGYYERLLDEARGAGQAGGDTRFDLRFNGGTAREYVKAIRRACPDTNIVVISDIRRRFVPNVELKNVTVLSALKAIEGSGEDEYGVRSYLKIEAVRIGNTDEFVYTVRLEQEKVERLFRVWSVSDLLESGVEENDIVSATLDIMEIAGMEFGQTDTRIRFHPRTGLLIARAPVEALMLMDMALDGLRQDAMKEQEDPDITADSDVIEELRARITELERQLDERDND